MSVMAGERELVAKRMGKDGEEIFVARLRMEASSNDWVVSEFEGGVSEERKFEECFRSKQWVPAAGMQSDVFKLKLIEGYKDVKEWIEMREEAVMGERNNLVAHCQVGSSDKVYIASVRRESDRTWTAVCKFGRRGKTMQSQVKARGMSEGSARHAQVNIFNEKLQKGYVDIESRDYSGPLTLKDPVVMENLEDSFFESRMSGIAAKAEKDEIEKRIRQQEEDNLKDMEALCVDSSGMEDSFDKGIEYVFEPHKDKAMLYVYDKFGKKRECFKERFRLVKAS